MRVVVTFNLDDDADGSDYRCYVNSRKMRATLSEFASRLRYDYKHKELTAEESILYEEIVALFYEIADENNLCMDSIDH